MRLNLPVPVDFRYCVNSSVEANPALKIEMLREIAKVLLENIPRDVGFWSDIVLARVQREI